MRLKLVIVISAVVLAAAACTGDSTPGSGVGSSEGSVPQETLLLGTDSGPLAIRVPAGSVVFDRAGAVASPDGSLVFSGSSHGRSTVLRTIEGTTGEVVSTTRIAGHLDVRVVSGTGRVVALMAPLPDGWDPATPIPRSHTTIVVADPTGARGDRTYELDGNFEPEAFSTDDQRLFMIQHLPAETPTVYRVTVLDLVRGRVKPVFGPFESPPERMPGTRLQQVFAPDGDKLYTLYTSSRPGYAPHGAPVPSDASVSFVHVLSLSNGWAHCVGLPRELWNQPASAQAIAASSDGTRLYIVDSVRGMVSVMDTETLEMLRSETIDFGHPVVAETSAKLSADDRTLFVGTGGGRSVLYAIDTTTFDVTHRWPVSGDLSGLGLSVDGLRLYLALGDHLAVLDPTTGTELSAVPFTSPVPIAQVSALGA
jgi:DNA-binding beta-propeller fold protein YncE